ncbi:MAG: EAL domain-containing protein, partial [Clostridia bacterium]|nr:EAL domain-containing protein [Clostridia bacterium]
MKRQEQTLKLNKMRIVQVVVLTLILLVTEFATWFTVYTKAVGLAYDGLQKEYTSDVKRVGDNLNALLISDAAAPATAYDWTGTLSDITLEVEGKHSGTAASSVRKNLAENSVSFYTLYELFENRSGVDVLLSDSNVYAIYSEKQEDGSVVLSARNFTDLVNETFSLFGFEGIVLTSDGGRIIYPSTRATLTKLDISTGYIERKNLPEEGTLTRLVANEKYVLSLTKIAGTQYYIGGYADFSEESAAISSLSMQIIIMAAILSGLTVALIIAGVYLTGGVGTASATYELTTDGDGRILKANKAFREQFPGINEIAERINRFDEQEVYPIKIVQDEEEHILTCSVNRRSNGTILVTANKLTIPYGTDMQTERRESMENLYKTFVKKKRVLLGEVFFDLHDIKTMFGREFSEQVRAILVKRVHEKLRKVYEIDNYHVGVLFPDGRELDIVLRDLPDYVEYFNQPVRVADNLVNVPVKCGFAISDKAMESRSYEYAMTAVEAALKRCREAKYQDGEPPANYYVYQEAQKRLYAKYFFKIDIRKMLANDDFELEYQPQYSVKNGRIIAFEALFRVKKRVQVKASTFEVISYAERSGFMVLLGDFIFNTGMRFAKTVEGMGVSVSLNVSPVQLMQAGFVDNFLQIYRKYDLKPGAISLEITESFLMSTFDETLKKLEILRSHGIDFHLDDFGTAYSSFLYLKQLPISAIKIDRSFIKDICENRYSELISGMILGIANQLDLGSICEGVETMDQLRRVVSLGGDVIQGYLVSKSVDGEKAREMITSFHLDMTEEDETDQDQDQ